MTREAQSLKMSSRQTSRILNKKFKEALVLFTCDKKTGIISTKNIFGEIKEGKNVNVKYGEDTFEAEIIKLSDDRTVLNEEDRRLQHELSQDASESGSVCFF